MVGPAGEESRAALGVDDDRVGKGQARVRFADAGIADEEYLGTRDASCGLFELDCHERGTSKKGEVANARAGRYEATASCDRTGRRRYPML